jgi:hypothetical protein
LETVWIRQSRKVDRWLRTTSQAARILSKSELELATESAESCRLGRLPSRRAEPKYQQQQMRPYASLRRM